MIKKMTFQDYNVTSESTASIVAYSQPTIVSVTEESNNNLMLSTKCPFKGNFLYTVDKYD